jgi:hypothetical protein
MRLWKNTPVYVQVVSILRHVYLQKIKNIFGIAMNLSHRIQVQCQAEIIWFIKVK